MSIYKNIRTIYIIVFFENLIFAYVIERLFALERGMTVRTIVYAEIIYSVTVLLLGIPFGALADMLGRKRMLVLGSLFFCGEWAVLIFARGFWLFGLSALLAGVGGACVGGARNALIYDTLYSCGRQDEFEKALGRVYVIDIISTVLAGLSGAVLAGAFGFTFNYWLSVGCVAIAFLFTWKLVEPPRSNAGTTAKTNAVKIVRAALVFFKTHTDVFWVVIHTALVLACINYVDEFWQVYLNDVSFPLVLFGVASAVMELTHTPGALLAARLLRRWSHRTLIAASLFLSAAGILWAALIKSPLGIIGMAAVCFTVALMEPVTAGYIHRRADPDARATIDSLGSMAQRGFIIVIGLAFGYLSDRFTIFTGFWLVGVIAAAASLVFLSIKSLRSR